MSKRTPPAAGFWLHCLCGKSKHDDTCEYLSVYNTDGTFKNMKYIHFLNDQWYGLTWTCFPFAEQKAGELQYFATIQEMIDSLGTHKFSYVLTGEIN